MFFFLMIRRPPRSTLFPTRRSSDLAGPCRADHRGTCHESRPRIRRAAPRRPPGVPPASALPRALHQAARDRSEEHTSELQSRQYLVCRLLLEKKKKKLLTLYLPPSS